MQERVGSEADKMRIDTKAFIFCAGFGTRLGNLTKSVNKEMLEVGGRPVLKHLVDQLQGYGIIDIAVNLHHAPSNIYDYFGDRLLYFYEKRLLATEHTIRRMKPWLGDHFLTFNGDTMYKDDFPFGELIDSDAFLTEVWSDTADFMFAGARAFNYHGTGYKKICIPETWIDVGTPEGLKRARKEWK